MDATDMTTQALERLTNCAECGMPCAPGEFHPYAACLMFKACHNSGTVRENLAFVRQSLAAGGDPKPAQVDEADGNHGLDTDEMVRFYERDFYVLSNFSSFRLNWRGIDFDTSEAVYHWEKFDGTAPEVQDMIREARSAHDAFKLAESQKVFRREDWDSAKLDVMRRILRAKADQHEYVRRKLLATGTRTLVEDSWRDDYWGWGPNRDGQNMLGKLWMEVRAALTPALQPEPRGTQQDSAPGATPTTNPPAQPSAKGE